jgi:hypothetical protein
MISDTDFQDPGAPKAPAIPEFFTDAVHLAFQSQQAGRPLYEDREFVRILIPGDRRSIVVEPVNAEHKARWPRHYEAFKAGREAPLEGTPLSEWPCSLMTPARVKELAFFNIRSIEALAEVSDAALQNLGMGARELRERARTWLEIARKGSAPIERLIARVEELERETERLSRDLLQANAELAAAKAMKGRDADAGAAA